LPYQTDNLKAHDTLYPSALRQYPNLSTSEFGARFRVINGVVLRTLANPVRSDARPLVTLPSAIRL